VISQALQLALVGLSPPPRDIRVLLELLKELLVEIGEGLSVPEAADYLRSLKVSGKTGKLSQDLLCLAGRTGPSSRLAAARALTGRVERAGRWTRSLHRDSVDTHDSPGLVGDRAGVRVLGH
jgi:hypothetical protein